MFHQLNTQEIIKLMNKKESRIVEHEVIMETNKSIHSIINRYLKSNNHKKYWTVLMSIVLLNIIKSDPTIKLNMLKYEYYYFLII